MAKYTRQDILDLIEEEDVKFIRLQFTDIAGNLKNTATTVDQIDKILSGRCRFNCAAVDGFRGVGYEELFLVPDLDTFVTFPGINTVEELCNRTSEDMMKVRNLGRKSLEEVLSKLKELGLSLNLGDE